MRASAAAIAAVAGALVASGCAGSGPKPTARYLTSPPTTSASVSLESPRVQQIQLARASNRRVYAIFPAQPGRRKCLISAGGAHKTPLLLDGICVTSVHAARTHEPALIVTFTEKWQFPPCPRGSDCIAGGRIVHHTWHVIEGEPIVTAGARLRVVATRTSGATAPQDYK